jgi:hypothetical protein
MEKLIYLLWKDPASPNDAWCQTLRNTLPTALRQAGANHLRLNLADADVAAATSMRMSPEPPLPDALISLWLDSASQRATAEAALAQQAIRLAGYLVTESEPLPNVRHPATEGERVFGMNHIVFLQTPTRLSREEWLDLWLNRHTQLAIDTQTTFGYRQNLVARRLHSDAPAIDAIVEENFPPAAIGDQNAFYRRESEEELQKNQKVMYQSCRNFIDFDKIGRLPSSEYNFL